MARQARIRKGKSGQLRLSEARIGQYWTGRLGKVRNCFARSGEVLEWQVWMRESRSSAAWIGMAGGERCRHVGTGKACRGEAGLEWLGNDLIGVALDWKGTAGEAWRRQDRKGEDRYGRQRELRSGVEWHGTATLSCPLPYFCLRLNRIVHKILQRVSLAVANLMLSQYPHCHLQFMVLLLVANT